MPTSVGPIMPSTLALQKLRVCFEALDSERSGLISLSDAFKLFGMCELPQSVIMQILVATKNKTNGFLDFDELAGAMHHIYMVQTGHKLTSDLLSERAGRDTFQLPRMEGLNEFLHDSLYLRVYVATFPYEMCMLYDKKLKPLETKYSFGDFVLPPTLDFFEFMMNPIVMVLGESSTGKTSFINKLLNRKYPRSKLSFTNTFCFLKYGDPKDTTIGSHLALNPSFGLDALGDLKSQIKTSVWEHPLLKFVTFMDTPGIRDGCLHNSTHAKIISWCANKCDMILLFFDPHKPEICAEFKQLLSSLHGLEHKFRIVIFRVHDLDHKELSMAYGSLMWSLGKIINAPDVCRAYLGFSEKEQNEFVDELESYGNDRIRIRSRIAKDFAKRAKNAKIHACIMSHLKKKVSSRWRNTDHFQLCDNLEGDFVEVSKKFGIPLLEFPRVNQYKEVLKNYDLNKLKKLKPKLIETVEDMLANDIPRVLHLLSLAQK